MPVIESDVFVLPAKGRQILTLVSCELREFEDSFKEPLPNGEKQKTERLLWTFSSDALDEKGDPGKYVIITGTKYGSSKANLTALLNTLVPDMDETKAKGFNTDVLIGCKYTVNIQHQKDQRTQAVKAVHTYMVPV